VAAARVTTPSPLAPALPARCPICGSGLEAPRTLPRLEIARCPACAHRVAAHAAPEVSGRDYHEQYDDALAEALRTTRTRQAGRILALARRHVSGLSRLVDYGAGRGWFLEACRGAGIAPLAGLDTSRLSVEGLAKSGIEAHALAEDGAAEDALRRLSFPPRVVTLLDVVEHFPPPTLAVRLRGIVGACGSGLELVVIKVPVPGLLYAGAAALRGAGVPGPLLQLYQSGTWPPHFNYFSRGSIRRLAAAAGLSVLEAVGDADFEAASFGPRIGMRGGVARALARLAGGALSATVHLTRTFDSLVVLARPGGGEAR
jgi:hypothetical protein